MTTRIATQTERKYRRRGAIAVFAAISMVVLLGMAALVVDAGILYATRAELQRSADAAALAGAEELLNDDRLRGASATLDVFTAARQSAATYAASNVVYGQLPTLDHDQDIQLGQLNNLANQQELMSLADPDGFNAVAVHLRKNYIRNGPIDLLFARIFGLQSANLGAEATAAYEGGVVGFRVTPKTGNAELLPFTLHVDYWNSLMNGLITIGDNYSYNRETGAVTEGSDGVLELNLYPGAGADQLPPGNFGTVDIGSNSNSSADIARQIVEGVNETDLSYFGGELQVPVDLNGDTGLSAGIKDELESVIGQARAIPLFNSVTGPGNNSTFHVIKFVGIRIMSVKLTGPMNKKHVIIQPAYVVDDSAVTDPAASSDFVFQRVRLVR